MAEGYPWNERWWSDMSDADCDSKDLTEFILSRKRERTEGLKLSPDSYDFIMFVAGIAI